MAQHWDAIVIGTGLGGANAGRGLVDAGMKVLFIERAALPSSPDAPAPQNQIEAEVTIDGGSVRRVPTSISAVGGTSVIYAASLELPERHDLDDLADHAHPTGGWPVGFDSFAPYLAQARQLSHIQGTHDPLNPEDCEPLAAPPPLAPGDSEIARYLEQAGYHPYRAQVGMGAQPRCEECIGRECRRLCKSDAREPLRSALATGRAALLAGWTVQRIDTDGQSATGIVAVREGEAPLAIRADRVILAGGSIGSAQLLLASTSEAWPNGIGNRHDQVGRNLMFHLSERMAIFPGHRKTLGFPAKSLALRDLYFHDGLRMGLVQSMGLQADYGNVLMHLRIKFDSGRMHYARPLRPFLRLPAAAAAAALGNARVFVGILEDMPYPENRILPGSRPLEPARIAYSVKPELDQRRQGFRSALRKMFRGKCMFFLNEDVELNFGHACGTARFGTDPKTSVLDPDCRVHGLTNLYVTDASFMPTSTGVNPGLIILANSLRVADRIIAAR